MKPQGTLVLAHTTPHVAITSDPKKVNVSNMSTLTHTQGFMQAFQEPLQGQLPHVDNTSSFILVGKEMSGLGRMEGIWI